MNAASITDAVRQVVDLLVDGKFHELAALTHNRRLCAKDIESAIEAYGRRLTSPPAEAYEKSLDAVQVERESVPTWSIRMPLWTKEEGRSDLTIELTLAKQSNGYEVEIDDIHVF